MTGFRWWLLGFLLLFASPLLAIPLWITLLYFVCATAARYIWKALKKELHLVTNTAH